MRNAFLIGLAIGTTAMTALFLVAKKNAIKEEIKEEK